MKDFVAVITASAPVSGNLADSVAARIGAAAGAPRRLSDRFVEIPFSADEAPPRDAVRPDLPVDVNVIPAHGRRKSVLIADMDSTIIGVECIDELADYAGVKPQVAAITERAMRGELNFEDAIHARVALLAGLDVAVLERCHAERVRLNEGAEPLVRGMRARGARTALVSGGFTFFSERVASAAGFHSHQANTLEVRDGKLTGRVVEPVLGQAAKAQALAALCEECNVGPDQVLAIGDGANDLAMIRAAGLGVAFRPKPALAAEADAVLEHSDLTAVLALQGLHPGGTD